ncbi:hypothetical protein TNCV_2444741 [Trichonephila clavipes]|nr:hypothetical protein TNCV_2444741 [Trichonephila clavipes]
MFFLHDAKSTTFMSTLDLKSGYHQVEVNPADQDKTAFVALLVHLAFYHPNGCKQLRPRCSSVTRRKSPTDEQPVEYASRLLSSAEKITRQQSEKPWL